VGTYDESELCKLLLEISLLDSAHQRSTASREDVLMDAAKRYRVDTEKLQKAVAKEFATKRDKKTIKPKGRKAAAQVDPFLICGGVRICPPPFLLNWKPARSVGARLSLEQYFQFGKESIMSRSQGLSGRPDPF
jgi:hypothetical protein